VLDLTIDLGQALLTAHGQDGVTEGHQNSKQAENGNEPRVLQKSERVVAEFEVRGNWGRRKMNSRYSSE